MLMFRKRILLQIVLWMHWRAGSLLPTSLLIFLVRKMTVNEILRNFGDEYRKQNPFLTIHEMKIMRAIEICRTQTLGGRIEVCDHCGNTVKLFHSCRNRHCPQCQFIRSDVIPKGWNQWIQSDKVASLPNTDLQNKIVKLIFKIDWRSL